MAARYETVPIDSLDVRYESLRLVRPELVAPVRRSVRRHGVLHPLVVNGTADGVLVLLDGFKRRQVLGELELTEAPVRVVRLDEAAAQAAMVTFNQPHRGLCELEEAWVVHSLVRKLNVRQVDVAELVARHKTWVCRRLLLAERLAAEVQDDMRLGLVSATVARELGRLPRGNQARVAKAVRDHGLTSRQTAALVERCLACDDPAALDELVADPLRFLAGKPGVKPDRPTDPRLSSGGEQVRQRLLRFELAATSVSQVLRKYPPSVLRATDLEIVAALAAAASGRGSEALEQIGQLRDAAGGGQADA